MTPEMVEAVVTWWSKTLARPKHDAVGPARETDLTSGAYWEERKERHPMELASIMVALWNTLPGNAAIVTFGQHLRDVLTGKCDHQWNGLPIAHEYCYLSVDYGPDLVLQHCGEVAGFPESFIWPWKTGMWVDEDRKEVRVRYGYGAPIMIVQPDGSVTERPDA